MSASEPDVAVVGGGPAGLMAAETLSRQGLRVTVFDRMPSLARKFLMAGRGGLNLTHSEPFDAFEARYGDSAPRLRHALETFTPRDLVAWAEGLGQPTIVGASGRVFPKAMKASPLLRAWLARLATQGVEVRTRWTWRGWDDDGALSFKTPQGEPSSVRPRATVLALGGASWPRLGSDGAWTSILEADGVELSPLRPANSGVDLAWTDLFRDRFAGEPVKAVRLRHGDRSARGDLMVTRYGLEGGPVYALQAAIRDDIAQRGQATIRLDLRPDQDLAAVHARLERSPPSRSLGNRLRQALALPPVAVHLLYEAAAGAPDRSAGGLAALVKAAPLSVLGVQPLDRAISTAGGVAWPALKEDFSLKARPDVFVAGEIIDWEAPTGGYLLQACFATGAAAARGVLERLRR